MVDQSYLRLYHAPRTRSLRVRWLLEEMKLPYTLESVAFAQRPAGDEAYADIHPLRKVPALADKGRVMFESVAIMQYIMGRYGPTDLDVKPDEADYDLFLQWLHFGESGMIMPVTLLLAHTVLLPEKARSDVIARSAKADTVKALALWRNTDSRVGNFWLVIALPLPISRWATCCSCSRSSSKWMMRPRP